jgi:hypothetical protein
MSKLDEHIQKVIKDALFDLNGVAVKGATHFLTVDDIIEIAKYFYKLGKEDSEEPSSIDYDTLSKMLDDTLSKETKESWEEFLDEGKCEVVDSSTLEELDKLNELPPLPVWTPHLDDQWWTDDYISLQGEFLRWGNWSIPLEKLKQLPKMYNAN